MTFDPGTSHPKENKKLCDPETKHRPDIHNTISFFTIVPCFYMPRAHAPIVFLRHTCIFEHFPCTSCHTSSGQQFCPSDVERPEKHGPRIRRQNTPILLQGNTSHASPCHTYTCNMQMNIVKCSRYYKVLWSAWRRCMKDELVVFYFIKCPTNQVERSMNSAKSL